MTMASWHIWLIIITLGVGTFLIRFSFLGLLGNRALPPWVLRHLRYTAVAVLPAIATPLVLWPAATEGQTDPARLGAAVLALVVGYVLKNAIWAIAAGMGALYLVLYLGG
jgi:branched-subunit amino acid transport protein